MTATSLKELLTENDTSWQFRKTNQGFPCLDIILSGLKDSPSSIPCEECHRPLSATLRTKEFPFDRAGVIVRFNNILSYPCTPCGLQNAPEESPHWKIISRALDIASKQFAERDLRKPPSIHKLRAVLVLE